MAIPSKNAGGVLIAVGCAFLLILALVMFTGLFIPLMAVCAAVGFGYALHLSGIKYGFWCLLASLPISLNMDIGMGSNLLFPSEWILISLNVAVLFRLLYRPEQFSDLVRHPLSWMLFGYILFLVCSVVGSAMAVVSAKAALVRTLYVVAFFGGGYLWIRQQPPRSNLFNPYILTLIPILFYVWNRHMAFNFSKDVTTYITKPFFTDHTILSAVTVFMIPFALLQAAERRGVARLWFAVIAALMALAVFTASSRAAWVSVGAAFVVYIVARLRIPFSFLLSLAFVVCLLSFINSDRILASMKMNRYDSNARNAGIEEQTRSVANITNDQSNAERLNRWKCAVRMFHERPYFGFGAGTFQFTYLPFQRDYEMTRISVTTPYNIMEGRGGTAHNEFLLVLAESGIFAATCFGMAFVLFFSVAFRVYLAGGEGKGLVLAVLVAVSSFVVHSLFNNFMDTDKAAAPVYIALAIMVWADPKFKTEPR